MSDKLSNCCAHVLILILTCLCLSGCSHLSEVGRDYLENPFVIKEVADHL